MALRLSEGLGSTCGASIEWLGQVGAVTWRSVALRPVLDKPGDLSVRDLEEGNSLRSLLSVGDGYVRDDFGG